MKRLNQPKVQPFPANLAFLLGGRVLSVKEKLSPTIIFPFSRSRKQQRQQRGLSVPRTDNSHRLPCSIEKLSHENDGRAQRLLIFSLPYRIRRPLYLKY